MFLKGLVSDSHGNYSHARVIALLVGISATVFLWKLTLMGELTEVYLAYYLSYGVVHMNVSKALDVLNNFLAGRQVAQLRKSNANDNNP